MNHPVRTAAAVIALAALTLPTACTGGTPRVQAASSPAAAVTYSGCMRAHGVPDFPDPDPGSAAVPKVGAQQLGVSDSQLQAAETACRNAYPDNGSTEQQQQQCLQTGDCPPALVQQILAAERGFAQCMRSAGVADWPDPTVDSEGRPVFQVSTVAGRNRDYWHSSQMSSKVDGCQRQASSPVPFG